MSEVQGREKTRTDEPRDAEAKDADPRDPQATDEPAAKSEPAESEAAEPAPGTGSPSAESGAESGGADHAEEEAPGTESPDAANEDAANEDAANEDAANEDADGTAENDAENEASGDAAAERPDLDAGRIKVKMPPAREIQRGDFTPHALGAKGLGAPRSGTRAAAKRRRTLYTTGVAVLVVLLVGGGIAYANRPEPSVKVKGAFGKAPTLSIPKAKPRVTKQVKELVHGTGPAVTKNDFVVAQLVAETWKKSGGKGKDVLDTYKKGTPAAGSASRLTGLPALDNELIGRKAGSRLLLTLPYKAVSSQVAQSIQLNKTDDFVISVDVLGAFGKTASAQGTAQKVADKSLPAVTAGAAGKAPTIKIPSGSAPGTLKTQTLIKGTGPVVAKNQTMVVQYHGVLWRNGKVFDSTWQRGEPAVFKIGAGQVIPGWDKGLVGQTVGSRVLLVVPPKEGYGKSGSPQGGIKGTDTLVFVVDILGSY